MSRIDELIAELAPDGVKYRALASLGRRNSGTAMTASKMKTIRSENGPVRIFAGGHTIADVAEDAVPAKDIIRDPSIIVKSRGHIGFTFYERPFTHKAELWSYTLTDPSIDQKFVYYYLLTKVDELQDLARATSVKLPQLGVRDTDTLRIPVPPLEVQREIVRVLDQFTQLEAELEAELEARRRQYEHYKDVLLTVPEETQWGCVGDVCRVFGGAPFKSDYFNDLGDGLPVVRIRDINSGFSGTYYSGPFDEKYRVHEGDILIGMDGDFKTVRWTHGDAVLNQRVSRLQDFDDENDPSFVFYLVRDAIKRIQDATQASTVKHLSTKQIAGIRIPRLPLDEQRERSAALDKFDALVNDLSIGLPAELAARRKQYEYYRDRLLTFEEAVA